MKRKKLQEIVTQRLYNKRRQLTKMCKAHDIPTHGISKVEISNCLLQYLTTRIITRFLLVSVLRVFLSSTLSIRLLRPMRMNLVLKEPNPDTGRINIRA
jgi:hypothetical protein